MTRYFVHAEGKALKKKAIQDLLAEGIFPKHDYTHVLVNSFAVDLDEKQVEKLSKIKGITVEQDVGAEPLMMGSTYDVYPEPARMRSGAHEYYTGAYSGQNVKIGVVDTGCAVHRDLNPLKAYKDFTGTLPSQGDDWGLDGHGTLVCGIIAADSYSQDVQGYVPKAQLYVAKVLRANDSDNLASDIVSGINWCVQQGVHIINLSLKSESTPVVTACQNAKAAGVIVVAAAGNDGHTPVSMPSSDPSCICVGAIDANGKLTSYSNYGSDLDIMAVGNCQTLSRDGGQINSTGTSLATPHVTGHLAVLKEKYPTETADQLINRLYANAKPLGDSYNYGHGEVYVEMPVFDSTGASISMSEYFDDSRTAYPITQPSSWTYTTEKANTGTTSLVSPVISGGQSASIEFTIPLGTRICNNNVLFMVNTSAWGAGNFVDWYVNGQLAYSTEMTAPTTNPGGWAMLGHFMDIDKTQAYDDLGAGKVNKLKIVFRKNSGIASGKFYIDSFNLDGYIHNI